MDECPGWGVLQRMGCPSDGVIRGPTKEKTFEVQGEADVLGRGPASCPQGRQGSPARPNGSWEPSHDTEQCDLPAWRP